MQSLACSQNKGLSESQRRAIGCIQAPIPHQRQRGKCVTARARRQGPAQILVPETFILHQNVSRLPVANHILLGSWATDTCRRVAAWDQLPRGDTWHSWETKWPGLGWWLRHMAHLGQCTCHTPGCLNCSDLGRAQNVCPTESVPLRSTHEPEWLRPGKCRKYRACFGQCPCRAPWSLSSVDPGSARCLELGQTQCDPYTVSTPPTCQWYLFVLSIPPHNTTEQMNLNKWSPSPLCVRSEIIHWRDLQTKEDKINEEGTDMEVTGATD